MPYVRDSFWRGRDIDSLPEMRAAALVWSVEVAGARAVSPAGRGGPGRGVRHRRARPAAAVADDAVRVGHLVVRARPGHPRHRRRDALLGAVALSGTGSTGAQRRVGQRHDQPRHGEPGAMRPLLGPELPELTRSAR
jgi:hypothetical protein